MKKILIAILLLLAFFAGTAQASMTYGSSYYLAHKAYVGSGNKKLDPLYLSLVEIDAALTGSSWTAVSGTLTLNHNAATSTIGIGTGTTTGAVNIGGTGTQTLNIGNGEGIKTVNVGSGTLTSATVILSGTGDMALTSTDKMTLTSTGNMALAATGTLAIAGDVWDIDATGAATFPALITGTAGATISGAAVNLNANSNFATNIGTGSTTAAVTIGNSANTTTINSPGIVMASGSKIYTTTTTLTATQVNALYTTAQAVTITPGAQEMIEVLGCSMFYNYGAAFTPGSATNLALYYTDKNGTICSDTRAVTGFLDGTEDGVATLLPIKICGPVAGASGFKNVPVTLWCAGAVMTDGAGSTLTVKVTYVVHPTGF